MKEIYLFSFNFAPLLSPLSYFSSLLPSFWHPQDQNHKKEILSLFAAFFVPVTVSLLLSFSVLSYPMSPLLVSSLALVLSSSSPSPILLLSSSFPSPILVLSSLSLSPILVLS